MHEKTETHIKKHEVIFDLFGDRVDFWILRISHL
jgi:hypothetical protein